MLSSDWSLLRRQVRVIIFHIVLTNHSCFLFGSFPTESSIIGTVTRIYPIISYRYVAHYTYHLQSTHLIYLPFVFLKILHLPIQVYTSQVHSILRYGVYPIISERGTPSPTSVSMCALTIAIHLEPTLKLHVNSFLLAF